EPTGWKPEAQARGCPSPSLALRAFLRATCPPATIPCDGRLSEPSAQPGCAALPLTQSAHSALTVNGSLIPGSLYWSLDGVLFSGGTAMQLLSTNPRATRRRAFTLMEVLVVVAIIVVLAGVGVAVFRYLDESKEKIALAGTKKLETAVTSYQMSNGQFPDSL